MILLELWIIKMGLLKGRGLVLLLSFVLFSILSFVWFVFFVCWGCCFVLGMEWMR